jgi:regulation of enolase protein 1 (concanavalin A-like superfamily)
MQTMQWLNEPPAWEQSGAHLTVTAGAKTDAWRITHDGGVRDTAHFFYQEVTGDFVAEVVVRGQYATLYDQAGLMIRLDAATWLKCGIEFFNGIQHASAVVTHEYSDWSVVPLPDAPPAIHLKVVRQGVTCEVHWARVGEPYTMIRQAYLTAAPTLMVGPMCAAPTGRGFPATFEGFGVQQF